MSTQHALSTLQGIQTLLTQLVADLPAEDVNRRFHPQLPSMGWWLGRAVYLELWWLRERLQQDDDLTRRVRDIFTPAWPEAGKDALLPPRDHLLNWALEIQEHHLTLLANPRLLPDHPWLRNDWLAHYLAQTQGRIYEQMLGVLQARSIAQTTRFHVGQALQARPPVTDSTEVSQGHYRIGARDGVVFDNEQPMQMVEMRNFRICNTPIDNAAWLAFMQDGGYIDDQWWSEAGNSWKQQQPQQAPWHWRQDPQGHWYGLGLNGPMELQPDQPVTGICWFEAEAFSRWAAGTQGGFQGAILPHEFHWEAAARIGALHNAGRVWEWCSNDFQPYADYSPPVDVEMASNEFDGQHKALRGGCLHTQPSLRRISIRHAGLPQTPWLFSGLRLVLPPAKQNDALYIEQWQQFLQH